MLVSASPSVTLFHGSIICFLSTFTDLSFITSLFYPLSSPLPRSLKFIDVSSLSWTFPSSIHLSAPLILASVYLHVLIRGPVLVSAWARWSFTASMRRLSSRFAAKLSWIQPGFISLTPDSMGCDGCGGIDLSPGIRIEEDRIAKNRMGRLYCHCKRTENTRELRKPGLRKAAGVPQCARLLKTSDINKPLQHVFNFSLLGRVPSMWKTSCIVPVPKNNRPSEVNDFSSHIWFRHWSSFSSASSGHRCCTPRTFYSLCTTLIREAAQSGSYSWIFKFFQHYLTNLTL